MLIDAGHTQERQLADGVSYDVYVPARRAE